jgi:hypothetical protein
MSSFDLTHLMNEAIGILKSISRTVPGELLEQQSCAAIRAAELMQKELEVTLRVNELYEMVCLELWDSALERLEKNYYPVGSQVAVVKRILRLMYGDDETSKLRPMPACECIETK